MAQRDVAFLNASGQRRRNDEGVVDHSGQFAAGAAGPGDGRQSERLGSLDAFEHIGGVAAGADGDGDVALPAMRTNLAGEEFFEPVVVRNTGNGRDIRGQGDGGEGRAFAFVTADELGGDVRGIRRAAAVAEEQDFMAASQGLADELRHLHDLVGMVPGEAPLDLGALVERLEGKFFHRAEL
jgi:hypothetical protein